MLMLIRKMYFFDNAIAVPTVVAFPAAIAIVTAPPTAPSNPANETHIHASMDPPSLPSLFPPPRHDTTEISPSQPPSNLRRPVRLPLSRRVKLRQPEMIRHLKVRLRIPLQRLEVHDQRVLDGKDGVVADVVACAVEDLRHDGLVVWGCELGFLLVMH